MKIIAKLNTQKSMTQEFLKPCVLFVGCIFTFSFSASAVDSYDSSHFFDDEISEARKAELIDRVKLSPIQPPTSHPRLYGTNDVWYQTIQTFESLDPNCNWQGASGQGTIKNIKSAWDKFSLGVDVCKKGMPTSIEDHSIANQYLNNTITRWNRNNALRTLHLIRRMNYCHEIGDNCAYTAEEIEQLSVAFIDYEMQRLRNAPRNASGYIKAWHKGFNGRFFDLGALPAFKLWTLMLDTFWHSEALSANDRSYIKAELENEINSYIEIYNLPPNSSGELGRWAIHNGNNWTPILNAAATFWALTFWHEPEYADKTRQVLDIILETNWLHRDEVLSDGAYTEGPGYLNVSLNGSIEMNNLMLTAFGEPNHAVKWKLLSEKTSHWMLENIATDGKFIDFGDVWARTGYADLRLMDLLYWRELVGLDAHGTMVADACMLEDFFATSYYLHAFYDTWSAPAHYARDFYQLTKQCQRSQNSAQASLFSEYQLGTLRQMMPGATTTAQSVTDNNIRNSLADQTFLAGNAVSNTFSHRELDFGAVIWTAFGNRLLSDWGYGELSRPYSFLDVRGSDGHYVASNNHFLEFSIKHISGQVNLSNFKLKLKLKGKTKELALSDYLPSLSNEWQEVSIPLSDFDVSDWQGSGQGIEYIGLRLNGFIKNGEFGLDEIKLVDSSGELGILWYGDSHSQSLDGSLNGVTPQISHPDRLQITAIETNDGAEQSNTWARISGSGSYSEMEIYYLDDPSDLRIANYMDKLPIGANTLVVPNAKQESAIDPSITHTSQFQGESGQIHTLDVQGKQAIHMNGSLVYGKRLNEGHLEYFHRYLIPLSDGNYIIVDSFKAKASKEDKIQEFWYSHKNPEGSCASRANDVTQEIDTNGALLLIPRCNDLTRTEEVESFGRISAASLNEGRFELGAPDFLTNNIYFNEFVEGNGLYMINRLRRKEQRNLARYVPSQPVREDVRVFLLQSSTSSTFANALVESTDCGDSVCFNVSIEGGDSIALSLNKVDKQYVLPGTNIDLPDGEDHNVPPPSDDLNILTPIAFTASHPNRVGTPEALFDEQASLANMPQVGSRAPEMRASQPKVNSSSSNELPMRQSVATDSTYGRHVYVDENGAPLSTYFTFELNALSTLSNIMYYDVSSAHRAGRLVVWASVDNENWTQVYSGMTGKYRQWANIDLANTQAKYIRFEMPEENTAKGITEVLFFGNEMTIGEEHLITPTQVNTLHPARLKNFMPLFDEQSNLAEKPVVGARTPDLRASRPKVNFSHSNDLPRLLAIETDSVYGRKLYVDENGDPMPATVIVELGQLYQLSDVLYFDMSSRWRPGHMVMSHSIDGITWTSFHDTETNQYRTWVNAPVIDVDAKFIKLDFYEQNAATAMSELLIYGRAYLN